MCPPVVVLGVPSARCGSFHLTIASVKLPSLSLVSGTKSIILNGNDKVVAADAPKPATPELPVTVLPEF